MPIVKTLPLVILVISFFQFSAYAQNHSNNALEKGSSENKSGSSKIEEKKKISYSLPRGKREIEIVHGFAPMQPTFLSGLKEYSTAGRKFGMVNIRWTRTIGSTKRLTYQYFFEVTPLAIAVNNDTKNPKFVSKTQTPNEPEKMQRTGFGFGIQPINFRFMFKRTNRIKPFVQVGAGLMVFNQKMPVADSTNFNFTGDFGGGLYITTDPERQRRALIIGYRYFHISNFHLSKVNPGYNANIFSLGYSFSR